MADTVSVDAGLERGRRTRFALAGDAMISRSLKTHREPAFLALRDLLREADVTIANLEMLFHDYEAAPAHISGGSYHRCSPRFVDDLRWFGIDALNTANNHTHDFGQEGLSISLNHLDRAALMHFGTGANLAEARAPKYLDLPNGRVAFIGLTTSGPQSMFAGHQWRDGRGRPGANMIRYRSEYTVDGELFDALRRFRDAFKLQGHVRKPLGNWSADFSYGGAVAPDTEDDFYLADLQERWQYPAPNGCRIRRGAITERTLVPNEEDLTENLDRISDARRMADWVVVSVHSHESGATPDDPSPLLVNFAHRAIEAGADIIHGHGPHRDRGIEIHRGRPIIYSLGHFIVEQETIERMPLDHMRRQGIRSWEVTPADFYDSRAGHEHEGIRADYLDHADYWHDAVVTVDFEGNRLVDVSIHPIALGFGLPRSQRGRPTLADGEQGHRIVEHFRKLSRAFGTEIFDAGNSGRLRIDQ